MKTHFFTIFVSVIFWRPDRLVPEWKTLRIFVLSVRFSLFFFEKGFKKHGAVNAQHSAQHFGIMIKTRDIIKVKTCSDASALRIRSAVYHLCDPRLKNRPGAHRARFQRNVKDTVFQTPGSGFPAGFLNCDDFRMSQG